MMLYQAPPQLAHAGLIEANVLLNGGMEVSQEFGTGTMTPSIGSGSYVSNHSVDQWIIETRGTFALTAVRSTDAPPGYRTSLKLTITTAQSSLGADDALAIYQPVEGTRWSKLGLGTSNALPFTIGFWVKAHRTGQYGGSIKGNGAGQIFPFSFVINSADTWEFKTLVVPANTSGSWALTGFSGIFEIAIALGTNLLSSGGAVWGNTNYDGLSGQVNGVAATSDVFALTGCMVIPGTWAIPAALSVALKRGLYDEIDQCEAFYEKTYDPTTIPGTATSTGIQSLLMNFSGQNDYIQHVTPFRKRKPSTPTLTLYDAAGNSGKLTTWQTGAGSTNNVTPTLVQAFGTRAIGVTLLAASGVEGFEYHYVADARLV